VDRGHRGISKNLGEDNTSHSAIVGCSVPDDDTSRRAGLGKIKIPDINEENGECTYSHGLAPFEGNVT
jgi:hypothetical protein